MYVTLMMLVAMPSCERQGDTGRWFCLDPMRLFLENTRSVQRLKATQLSSDNHVRPETSIFVTDKLKQ